MNDNLVLDYSQLDCTEMTDGIVFKIRVQPRSSRNMITGIHGDCLKICLNSPPVDGEANKACIDLFTHIFHVSKSKVLILNGEKNRNKTIKVIGKTKLEFEYRMREILSLC